MRGGPHTSQTIVIEDTNRFPSYYSEKDRKTAPMPEACVVARIRIK